jgi:predicted dehydrogenase
MHRIALIGAGRIGRIHAANVASHPELELAYVIDPIADAAKSVAARFGAKTADLDAALGESAVSGVIVASSTDTHLDFSLRAARAGKAIFCEKPIDLDLSRAQSAVSDFESAKARLFLAFNRRFDPNFRALKAKLDEGATHHQPRSGASPARLHSCQRRAVQRHGDPRLRYGALDARRRTDRSVRCWGMPCRSPDRRARRH